MSSLIVLKEGFKTFRAKCRHRSYFQPHTNQELMDEGKELGKWGIEHGYIRCDHPESKTGKCREDTTPDDCPRVEECVPH